MKSHFKYFIIILSVFFFTQIAVNPAKQGVAAPGVDAAALVLNGTAKCAIVIPAAAGETEKYAASELQAYIKRMSGAEMEILSEKNAAGRCAVLIGNSARGAGIVPDEELKPLGAEGFVLRARGGDMAIRGGGPRGTLYGVYSLLEDRLGVRWYAPDTTYVPELKNIVFESLDYKQKPAMEYREVYYFDAFEGDWAARNRLNGQSDRLEERHGGKITYVGGFVHTANALVPPDKYFAEHPEYFAEIGGVRERESQLCLTNPDVLKIVTARVLELAESTKGQPAIISVSQNDNFRHCSCPRCMAVDNEEGSHAGSLIRFVNQVADAVAEKYPNVAIDTLAYQYTENAPLHVKPRPNVIVRLCHMAPSCDIHPLKKCPFNANYVKNLKAWSRISNRLYIWHYVTDFAAYLLPLPNLNSINSDIPFYRDHHVMGLFAQGNGESPGAEMAELKSWLIAKLLWNPDANAEELIGDFVRGYYGPAAPAMAEYIKVQRDRVRSYHFHANLYSPPNTGVLNYELLSQMGAALDRAEKLAASDPLAAEHVRRARLWYTYTKLAAPELFVPKGTYRPENNMKLMPLLKSFRGELEHFKITRLREWVPLEESMKSLRLRLLGWKD